VIVAAEVRDLRQRFFTAVLLKRLAQRNVQCHCRSGYYSHAHFRLPLQHFVICNELLSVKAIKTAQLCAAPLSYTCIWKKVFLVITSPI
jgi:hypothetical protein